MCVSATDWRAVQVVLFFYQTITGIEASSPVTPKGIKKHLENGWTIDDASSIEEGRKLGLRLGDATMPCSKRKDHL